jgi:hypothetical protein
MGDPHFRVEFIFSIDQPAIRRILNYFLHIPLFIVNMGGGGERVSVSNTLYGQNLELLNVKLRGIYSDCVETPHLRRTGNPITVGKNYLR